MKFILGREKQGEKGVWERKGQGGRKEKGEWKKGSYFSLASLIEELIWASGPREIKMHHSRVAWQEAGIATKALN